jgi:hypothetical protein
VGDFTVWGARGGVKRELSDRGGCRVVVNVEKRELRGRDRVGVEV